MHYPVKCRALLSDWITLLSSIGCFDNSWWLCCTATTIFQASNITISAENNHFQRSDTIHTCRPLKSTLFNTITQHQSVKVTQDQQKYLLWWLRQLHHLLSPATSIATRTVLFTSTSGKLFTHVPLSLNRINWYQPTAVAHYECKVNCRSGVSLAMIVFYPPTGLSNGDQHHAYTPLRSMSTFTFMQ